MDQIDENPEVQEYMPQRLIQVIPYDHQWAQDFFELRSVLAKQLGPLALAIEHIGSTSVPGLAAKPILDIDVITPDRPGILVEVCQALTPLGYYHRGDLGISNREAFGRKNNQVPWEGSGRVWPQQHLYVLNVHTPVLAEFLAFRDYLLVHPDDVREYGEVKIIAAAHHPHDIDGYMEEKKECILNILRKAEPLKAKIKHDLERLI